MVAKLPYVFPTLIISLCNLLAAAGRSLQAGQGFGNRTPVQDQGEGRWKEPPMLVCPRETGIFRLLLCIAGTNSTKQQVAWHMRALFLVLISHSFIGNLL